MYLYESCRFYFDYHMNALDVYNANLRQSESRKVLQICNMICINGIHFENGVCLRTLHAILGMPKGLKMYPNESSTFLLPNDCLVCLECLFVKIRS